MNKDRRSPSMRLKELSEEKPTRWNHHQQLETLLGKRVVIKINAGMAPQVAAVTLVAYDQWTLMVRDDTGNEGVFFKAHLLSVVAYNPAHHDAIFKQAETA